MIIQVRVVLNSTIVGDPLLDNQSGSNLQSQVKIFFSVNCFKYKTGLLKLFGQFRRVTIG